MKVKKSYESIFAAGRQINHITYEQEGIPIKHLKRGTAIKTGGGSNAVITGRQTQTHIQIKLESGEHLGEYDWISKEAKVEENKDVSIKL